jgi:Domain of unknown function (DUF5615)
MNGLFIALYLDEEVDGLIADLIRARGFMATTTQEAGQVQNSDVAQWTYAVSQQCALLTHNRVHVEALAQMYFASSQTHYGIIIAIRRSPYEITRRLLRILNQVTAEEMQNQVRYI